MEFNRLINGYRRSSWYFPTLSVLIEVTMRWSSWLRRVAPMMLQTSSLLPNIVASQVSEHAYIIQVFSHTCKILFWKHNSYICFRRSHCVSPAPWAYSLLHPGQYSHASRHSRCGHHVGSVPPSHLSQLLFEVGRSSTLSLQCYFM